MNFSETTLAVFLGAVLAQLAVLAITGRLHPPRYERYDSYDDYPEYAEYFEPVYNQAPAQGYTLANDAQYTRMY